MASKSMSQDELINILKPFKPSEKLRKWSASLSDEDLKTLLRPLGQISHNEKYSAEDLQEAYIYNATEEGRKNFFKQPGVISSYGNYDEC
jgi:hypothetical protein